MSVYVYLIIVAAAGLSMRQLVHGARVGHRERFLPGMVDHHLGILLLAPHPLARARAV